MVSVGDPAVVEQPPASSRGGVAAGFGQAKLARGLCPVHAGSHDYARTLGALIFARGVGTIPGYAACVAHSIAAASCALCGPQKTDQKKPGRRFALSVVSVVYTPYSIVLISQSEVFSRDKNDGLLCLVAGVHWIHLPGHGTD